MDFDTQAGLIYSTLSDNEKDMIQYIRNHKADVVDMPINELAKVLLSSNVKPQTLPIIITNKTAD